MLFITKSDGVEDASARRAVNLLPNVIPMTYSGFSHGMLTVNAGVMDFVKA